ncbi:hypothetical protein COV06_02225 [Candidatus Uhrbacteria bacterium CG10_big_fil_rev_8_21_14_0_10_50_16]|uniref:Peptidase S8/S53 domain-containing protein n=1 Tax=Candidatus Uhrbacteria bacterium CG10_big_fil_rev_8_21_14_0_10_50_16 TaxID=1975039 RepID=A0A2H0RMF0_9BACT|nr:MAG: hypothetical protein COV06_02225 [Candidatus Uhrbacteria bacterium CG10_big_fil_rev_8_21_14_0_10_50_16]
MFKRILVGFLAFTTVVPWSFAFARTSNDPLVENQWYLDQTHTQEAWNSTVGGEVVVAVLDTGMDIQHEDLRGNIFLNTGEIAGDGIDNDGNGFIDDVHGWDFFHNDSDPSTANLASGFTAGAHHATIVAGVIGAVGNNALGVTGINWHVKILPVQVLSAEGDGSIVDIIDGIDYAVAMGADVINLSFVGNQTSSTLDRALQRAYDANVIVVTAMGNENQDLDINPLYPVCSSGLQVDNVTIGVVATDRADRRASFSNYGRSCADVAAPGIDIYTTQASDLAAAYGGGWNGTSLAAPIISGAAALARSLYPNMTPDELRIGLQLSVDPVLGDAPSRQAGAMGTGRANIARLLTVLPALVKNQTVQAPVVEEPVAEPVANPVAQDPTLYDRPLAIGAVQKNLPYISVARSSESDVDWLAYNEGFTGGVNIAVGQLDGAGRYEIVTVPGPGGGPHVRIFDEIGALVSQFFAFDASMTKGLQVATGDMNGDGTEEILVAAGGAQSEVRIFSLTGERIGTIQTQNVVGDLRIATGDMNGDGVDDLITSQGVGSEPIVTVYKTNGAQLAQFPVYGLTMDRGVYVTTVLYNGRDVIVTGTQDGAGPQVRIFNTIGALVNQFFAFDATNRDGVRVAGWQPYVGGEAYIVTSGMADQQPELRMYTVQGELVGSTSDLSPFIDRVTLGAGT